VTAGTSTLRTALRRTVLGAFLCTAAVMVVLVGMVLLSVAGLSFDPHGYTVIFGLFLTLLLAPVAMILWLVHQRLRP
jgi:hypothetical protein